MVGLDNADKNKFAKYDAMSTEELEELIRQDFYAPDGIFDTDTMIYITEVIAQRMEAEEPGCLPDPEEAWKDFIEHYKPFEDEKPLYDFSGDNTENPSPKAVPTKGHRPKKKYLRTVIAAAILAALLLALAMTTAASKHSFWDVIVRWTQETFSFVNDNDAPDDGDTEPENSDATARLQASLDSLGITAPLAPKWIPDGFELDNFSLDENSNYIFIVAEFSCGEKSITINLGDMHTNLKQVFEKDDERLYEYIVNGITHNLSTNKGRESAAWENGEYYGTIYGDITREELLSIIDSIYEKE